MGRQKWVYPKEASCVVCTDTFYILNYNQGKNKKTCSPDCNLESNRLSNIRRAEEKWGPKFVTNICVICTEPFEIQRAKKNQQTCSIKCGPEGSNWGKSTKYKSGKSMSKV